MRQSESIIFLDETHPIDALEILANSEKWKFLRDKDDEISIIIKGSWREYALNSIWNSRHESLTTICSFEMSPPKKKLSKLYETLNLVNTDNTEGTFVYSPHENLMLYRNSMSLNGELIITSGELKVAIIRIINIAEKFYPTFQITCWGDAMPKDAISVAFGEAAGYA